MDAGLVWTIIGSSAGVAAVAIGIVQVRQSRRNPAITPSADPPDEQARSPDTLVGLNPDAVALVAKLAEPPAPVMITAVSPQKGTLITVVKIFGYGFSGTSRSRHRGPPDVTFNGLAAAVHDWTDKQIRVTVPQYSQPGMADVTVVTPDGDTATLPNAFEVFYVSRPH